MVKQGITQANIKLHRSGIIAIAENFIELTVKSKSEIINQTSSIANHFMMSDSGLSICDF